MGCVWSDEVEERCRTCNRRAVNNLIIGHQCEICISRAVTGEQNITRGPKFGEYRCQCGRYWTSRLSWPDKYQMCKHCHNPVRPYKTREILDSDMSSSTEAKKEHVRELCQMCQQLGYSCNNFGNSSSKSKMHRKL